MNAKQQRLLIKRQAGAAKSLLVSMNSLGNLSHIEMAKWCYGHDSEMGRCPQSFTKRQAAQAIVTYYQRRCGELPKISQKALNQIERLGLPKAVKTRLRAFKRETFLPAKSQKIKTPDELFFASRQWQELRYKAFKLHGAACQCCGATALSSGRPMHCDHVLPRYTHPELEWEITNLQILCEACNLGKGAWDKTDWRAPVETPESLLHAEMDAEFRKRMN